MRIKKTFQGSVAGNKILNTMSTSKTDTYSCDYINSIGTGGSGSGTNIETWNGYKLKICTQDGYDSSSKDSQTFYFIVDTVPQGSSDTWSNYNLVVCTQAEYDSSSKNSDSFYFIVEG